jgi:FecR protein
MACALALLAVAHAAEAAPPTPGFPEPVVQWGVQKGETCDDIAKALYGSPKHAALIQRYNHVACKTGAPLKEGMTLILPETPTTLPDARLRSMNPDVRARPGGAGWAPAATGMPLFSNYNVNTLDSGRADIEFIDRTRVFLAANTLVVIYGTASQTRVSKTPPAAVEVEAGEVKTGLAALRGDAVEVTIKGGGRVSAASRDTVVQRKGDRTTVEVFDGKAGVASGGKTVEVPKNYGSRFFGVAPPAPPRPLPPPPAWASGGAGETVLAPGGVGVISASWSPVPVAVAYRVELSRDEGFHDLVSRDEVPATITAFRAEKVPVGTYYLAVRAIDKEEYLGVASPVRVERLVDASLESGHGVLNPKEVEANPYGILHLAASPQLEVAIDDGPFGPVPTSLDLLRRAPKKLRFRPRGGEALDEVPVRYTKVSAAVTAAASPDGRSLVLEARLEGFDGVDIPTRVAPHARVRLLDGPHEVTLAVGAGGALSGTLALPAQAAGAPAVLLPARVRVDVVDDRGTVLGSTEWVPPPPPAAHKVDEREHIPQIGPYAPLWQVSQITDVMEFAPTPPDGAAASVGLMRLPTGGSVQGQIRASGSVGPIGLEAAIRSGATGEATEDASAWFGVRGRVLRLDGAVLELAPALRVGFPVAAAGAPARIEPAVAVGGAADRFTWLADVGGRFRLEDDKGASGAPPAQGFVILGGTMDVLSWMRLNASVDAHLVFGETGQRTGLAGLGLGIETGTRVYGGLGLHFAPWWAADAGPFSAQLALGFRGLP